MPSTHSELTVGFLNPWETDFTEGDNSRTYAVNKHRTELIAAGHPVCDVETACTDAAWIVKGLLTVRGCKL